MIDLAVARTPHARVRWTHADLEALPFQNDTFDGVLSECVLSTTDRAVVLGELARVLRPGGLLLLTDVEVGRAPSRSSRSTISSGRPCA